MASNPNIPNKLRAMRQQPRLLRQQLVPWTTERRRKGHTRLKLSRSAREETLLLEDNYLLQASLEPLSPLSQDMEATRAKMLRPPHTAAHHNRRTACHNRVPLLVAPSDTKLRMHTTHLVLLPQPVESPASHRALRVYNLVLEPELNQDRRSPEPRLVQSP
jgi:hypothetical protein